MLQQNVNLNYSVLLMYWALLGCLDGLPKKIIVESGATDVSPNIVGSDHSWKNGREECNSTSVD